MRWTGSAFAGSLAVHAALAIAAAWWHRDDKVAIVAPADGGGNSDVEVDSAPAVATAPVPIELVTIPIVAEPAAVREAIPTETGAAPIRARGGASATAPAGSTATEQITTGTGGPETGPGPQTMLSMRDPVRRPHLDGGGAVLEHIAEGGQAPAPIPESGRVQPAGQGARVDDLVFTGRVDPDGTMHIEDKPNVNAHFTVPSPKAMGKAIAHWAEDPYAFQKERTQPGDDIENAPRGDRARLTPTDQKPDQGQTVPIIGGGFDVTAWVSEKAFGKAKGDVYQARKRLALEQTFDQRAEMRRRFRKDQLDHADQIVRDTLDRLWSSPASVAEKKEAMFELWDDCAETGEPAIVAASARARRDIVGYIRARLPAGSPDAYSAAEIAALDAHRTSHAHFAPYDDGGDDDADVAAPAPAPADATGSAPAATSP